MAESYDNLILVETADKLFIHPGNQTSSSRFLVINRVTDEISLGTDINTIPDSGRIRTEYIAGVIGVIRLIAGPYLVLVKTATRVGEFNSHVIWQMKQHEVIPFKRSDLHMTVQQRQFNQSYLEMLDSVLSTPYFYYSHTYDLSHNLQSLNFNSPDFFQQSVVARADERYVWNTSLIREFPAKSEFHNFCIALIHGFVSISDVTVNSRRLKLILISRRSSRRPGTRYFSRGIDSDGSVSNFVETEQIVDCSGEMSSFVQIRGSIPLYWTQKPNLRYKPKPTVVPANHSDAFAKHFEDLVLRYNRIVCIDLVNQTGSEAVLETAFSQQVQSAGLPNIRYEAFDFHHECANMKWHRLDILTNRLTNELDDFGYFLQLRGQRQQSQEGIFRTNCIDCLDRTNVVQGMLAKINLEKVLQRFGILRDHEKISDHSHFEYLFKNVWADNGDIVSIEYSGTGALKSDFTRTGKRNFAGVMRDGYNSGVRYLKNNFSDGHRQDAIDLFLGNYSVDSDEGNAVVCPLDKNRDWKFYSLPLLLLVSLIMTTMLAILPAEYSTENLMYLLFWGSMFLASGAVILAFGRDYVDNPVLCPGNDPTDH